MTGSLHLVPLDDDEIVEGEIVEYDADLDAIAGQVRAAQARGAAAGSEIVDAYFEIGHCLERARALMPSDQEYGEWFRAQNFGFNQQWSHVLRQAAQREIEVRAAVTSQLVTGHAPNIEKAVRAVRHPQSEPAPRDPSKPRRGPLHDSASTAAWALRKSVESMERIFADDRFTANKEQVAAHTRGHLTYAVEACQGLLGQLDH